MVASTPAHDVAGRPLLFMSLVNVARTVCEPAAAGTTHGDGNDVPLTRHAWGLPVVGPRYTVKKSQPLSVKKRVKAIEMPKPAGTVMLHAQLALLLNILESGFVETVVPEVVTVCVPEHGAADTNSRN